MEIECGNHREVGKGIQNPKWHTRIAIGKKLKTQISPTYHQHLRNINYHSTWTQGWLTSHVLSPQAQHRIFPIFHTWNAHIECDNHSI